MEQLQIFGLSETIAHCEALGLSKCFKEYSQNFAGDEIMGIGFNPNSGYTYIALESGIQICSMLGQNVEFCIQDFETGEECFFETYMELENFLQNNN